MTPRTSNKTTLAPLAELKTAPARRGIRLTAADSPRFNLATAALWRTWLEVAAGEPRTRLVAQDAEALRSFHIQRSRVFRFPDLIRAEIIELGSGESTIAIDSRARYGYYDFGVNRQRVQRWMAKLSERIAKIQS